MNYKNRFAISGVVLLCLLIFVLTVLFWQRPLSGPSVIRLGVLPLTLALPVYVAETEGLFHDEGIIVDIRPFLDGRTMAMELFAGGIDATAPGPGDIFLLEELGEPGRFRIYMHCSFTPERFIMSLIVSEGSEINGLYGLRNKKIGTFPGPTNAAIISHVLLSRFGWERDADFHVIGIVPSQQLTALVAGEVDALTPLEPLGTIAASQPGFRMAASGFAEEDWVTPFSMGTFVVSANAIESMPDTVDGFVRAMERAAALIEADEARYRPLLTPVANVPPELVHEVPLGIYFTAAEAEEAKFQNLADLLNETGILTERVNVGPLYYNRP